MKGRAETMENQPMQDNITRNPRRRRKSKAQIFREVYLPFILVAIAVFAVICIIVAVVSNSSNSGPNNGPDASNSKLEKQAEKLLTQAEALATTHDYEGALELLKGFTGDLKDFPEVADAITAYTTVIDTMVSWNANQVYNLSFHTLIADLEAALADKTYGQSGNNKYNSNFISTDEFSTILTQLYEGDYVLVSLSDLYEYDEESNTYVAKELKLPANKKPVMLTETHCSYYNYMANSHAFATKLLHNKDGFYNELVKSDGSTVTGSYDMVPILESFIKEHPNFSYKGARATLAFSGYNGIFGYRITSESLSADALAKEQADATALIQALRDAGYDIACYSYDNVNYSNVDVIRADLAKWKEKIAPVLGQTDILVFPWDSDIGTSYQDNSRFDVLYENGFRYFMGSSNIIFSETGAKYVRHNRLSVTGSNLANHSSWFKDILNTDGLLDSRRGKISE